jgi:hypothetical protein
MLDMIEAIKKQLKILKKVSTNIGMLFDLLMLKTLTFVITTIEQKQNRPASKREVV